MGCRLTGETPPWKNQQWDWNMMMMMMAYGKGKGKGKGRRGNPSIICEDMKKNGTCPRGTECKYCKLMIEKFGTNDWSDQTCWEFKKNGECKRGENCKWQH